MPGGRPAEHPDRQARTAKKCRFNYYKGATFYHVSGAVSIFGIRAFGIRAGQDAPGEIRVFDTRSPILSNRKPFLGAVRAGPLRERA